jgi:hypothetical protein
MSNRPLPPDQAEVRQDRRKSSTRYLSIIQILMLGGGINSVSAIELIPIELIPISRSPFTVTPVNIREVGGPILDLASTHWSRAANKNGIDPYVLYAVALVESAQVTNGAARPWPWALNEGGKALYPPTSESAIRHVRGRIEQGFKNIDIGLMQVNFRWHGKKTTSVERLIDPVTNVEIGAEILAESIASSPSDPILGIGRYHAWTNREEAHRYGSRVLTLASKLKRQQASNRR